MIDHVQESKNKSLTSDELRVKIQTTVNKLEKPNATRKYNDEQDKEERIGRYIDIWV